MIDVVVIAGPSGVGKSATAFEMSNQLRVAGVPHAVIDTDALDHVYPPPENQWQLTERNLAAVWETFFEGGARRLVVSGVHLNRRGEQEWVRRATRGDRFTLVQLAASDAALAARLRQREIGSGRDRHLERMLRHLKAQPKDLSPDTRLFETERRSLEETAARIIEVVGWT
jgi:hypothetical protein